MKWRLVAIVSIRTICLLTVAFLSARLIPYAGNFPYRDLLISYNLSQVLYSWANFDGAHYINIARDGYHQFDQAFFPLYPLMIRALGGLLHKAHLSAGLLVSYSGFFIGIYYFLKLFSFKYDKKTSEWIVIFLVTFPTAFFFTAVYTEGIFLMFICLSLYFFYQKKHDRAGIFAFLASLTRLQGFLLIIPFVMYFYEKKKNFIKNITYMWFKHPIILISPFAGLGVYMIFLQAKFGNPLYFFTSQPAFGANRSTSLILLPQVYYRYLRIFFTADFTYQYCVAMVEFIFFNFVLITSLLFFINTWRRKDTFGIGISIFSLAHILLPPLTGTFSSIPRYALFAWAMFILLAQIKHVGIKYIVIVLFSILQIIFASLFIQGYFIS